MDTKMRAQPQVKRRRPGEFEPHAKTWMAWPHRKDLYGATLPAMQRAYADVARAIAQFEPVSMVVHPDHTKGARTQLGADIEIVALPIDDCWIRDSGPTFLKREDGGLSGVSWRFNAWGGKSAHDLDEGLARRVLNRLGLECFGTPLSNEGGAIHVLGRTGAADAAIVLPAAIAGQHDHRLAEQIAQGLETGKRPV